MKIYAVPKFEAQRMRELHAEIGDLHAKLNNLKDRNFKAALQELPYEYQRTDGDKRHVKPEMEITEDFNFVYTRNAK